MFSSRQVFLLLYQPPSQDAAEFVQNAQPFFVGKVIYLSYNGIDSTTSAVAKSHNPFNLPHADDLKLKPNDEEVSCDRCRATC